MSGVQVVSRAAELDGTISGRARGGCVLVPTMGALHAGHGRLVERGAALAREHGLAGGCVVSVFVNPTQFNDPKDLERYPRTLEADVALCERAGARVVYAPGVEDVYPGGPSSVPGVEPLPEAATRPGLEDHWRPGHFAGVCVVVRRLFELIRPRMSVFGEKDWQQWCVVRGMVSQLGMDRPGWNDGGLLLVAEPTVREHDELAMSSRNRFLSPEDRARASAVPRALREACAANSPTEAEGVMRRVLESAGLGVEYAVVRDAATLMPSSGEGGPMRALIAARVRDGGVRLIDNAAWPQGFDGG